MAFHRSTLLILYALFLSMEFSRVFAQIPIASPLPPGRQPPVVGGQAPVSAQVPVPARTLQPQVTNMIDALRDAGRFGAIAGLLDGLRMKSVIPRTTWLLPNDEAFSGVKYPKNVTMFLNYHVIRELLPFSRLLTLNNGTRIPTFLGSETCVVTNNNRLNFSIDNAIVVVPDLYSDSTVVVHGIDAVLDDASFSGIALSPDSSASPVPSLIPCTSGTKCSGSLSPGQGLNVTFPNAAHGLYAAKGFCMTVTILVAVTVLL